MGRAVVGEGRRPGVFFIRLPYCQGQDRNMLARQGRRGIRHATVGSIPLCGLNLPCWDRSWSGSVRLASGKIVSVSDHSGDSTYGEEFDLGRRDKVWQVRIYRKALGHEEFTQDIVSFTLLKIQFWLDH
ncbi:hypothetical protein [Nonomuraea typhae]|uniref:Uncharacterized protein n=1 Tax=Nonomuraea typhae TaxID=2603600 RepID=A0ABW7YR97_9ACTN